MTVTSVKDGADPEILKLGFSDGSLFYIRLSYLSTDLSSRLVSPLGSDFSPDEMEELRGSSLRYRTERAALRLISLREQTSSTLSLKLRKRDYPPRAIADVVSFLCAKGLLDDGRFARLWLETYVARHWVGRQKLLASLISRGVDSRTASSAIEAVLGENGEVELLRRYLESQKLSPRTDDPELRRKIWKAGFKPSLLRQLFDIMD